MFEGSVDWDAVNHEKPAWISRLRKSSQLENMLVAEAVPARRIVFYVFGYAAVAAGLILLIGSLVNAPYISW
jgi:hypothetical protein